MTFQTNEVSCMGVTKIFFCTGSMCDQWFHLCLVVEVNPLVWQSVKCLLKTLFLCQWLLYRCHCRKTLSDTKQTFYYIKKIQKYKIQITDLCHWRTNATQKNQLTPIGLNVDDGALCDCIAILIWGSFASKSIKPLSGQKVL